MGPEVLGEWRAAGERGDAAAAVRCLAEDVTVISPLTERFRFRGREQVGEMLHAAFEVIDEIRYHTEVGSDVTWALFYHGRAGRRPFEEAQLLRLAPEGTIRELTLFGRPLPGLTAVMDGIGGRLLRRQGRPVPARFVGAVTRPLALMTQFGERRVVPFADPARGRPRPDRP